MMNLFFKKLLLFSSILLIYLGLNYIVNILLFNNSKSPIKESKVLIMGDSHTRRAINPNLFDSAVNISQQSEPYILTYWKLKYLVKKIKIDTVLLAFSTHNISAFNDRKFIDKKWSSELFGRSYLIGNLENMGSLEVDKDEFYKNYFFNMLLYPNFNHATFIGEYENSNASNPDDAEKVINRHYYFNSDELGVSKTSINFMNKIIDLCKENKITLILVSTPVHETYLKKIPKSIQNNFLNLKDKFLNEGIQVIDLSSKNFSNELFYNSDHLNHKGAKVFTNELINFLKPSNFEK